MLGYFNVGDLKAYINLFMRELLFLLILLLVNVSLFSQEDGYIPDLVNDAVYEKVYLHIDRENYAPREDIWFKVYLVSGI